MDSIKFSYEVSLEDYYRALKLIGDFQISARKILIETVIMGAFSLIFFATFFHTFDLFSLFLGLACVVVLVLLNLLPRLELKRQAQQAPKAVSLELTPERLSVRLGEVAREVALDGSVTIKTVGKEKDGKLITVALSGGTLLVIPLESIPQQVRQQALSWLLQKKVRGKVPLLPNNVYFGSQTHFVAPGGKKGSMTHGS